MAPPDLKKTLTAVKIGKDVQETHTFDEALELVGFGWAQILLTFFSGCSMMVAMTESMGMSFIISAGHCDLELDIGQKGMVNGAIFLGIMMSSFFWGYQADTRGRQVVLKYALFATASCSLVSSFATSFGVLVVLRFVTGLCVSAASAVAYTYLGEFCTNRKRGQMVAYASAMIAFGIIYCAFIGWCILSYSWKFVITDSFSFRPWRLLFIVYTIPGFLCGVAFSFLPESPKFLLAQNRPDEALSVLKRMYQINSGGLEEYPVAALSQDSVEYRSVQKGWNGVWQSMKDQTKPLGKMPYLGYLIICCVNCVNVFAVYGGLCLWFPVIMNQLLSDTSGKRTKVCTILKSDATTYLPEVNECDETIQEETYFYTIILGCIGISCSLVLSFALKKFSPKTLMIVHTTTASAAGILLQFVTNNYVVAALFSVQIMFSATGVTLINAAAVSLFPTHVKGMTVSLINMTGRFSCFLFSTTIGVLMAQNCPVTIYAFSGLLLLSAGLTFMLP